MVVDVSRRVSRRIFHALPSSLKLLILLVSLFDLFVVFEVGEEFAPRDELFVIDGVVLLRQLDHLIGLIALDLVKDLVKGEDLGLLAGHAHRLSVNKVDHFHVHTQMLDVMGSLQNTVFVLIKKIVLLFHGLNLGWEEEALGLFSGDAKLGVDCLLVGHRSSANSALSFHSR